MTDFAAILRLSAVKGRPARMERSADASELQAIAERFELRAVKRFELLAELSALPEGDVFLARGDVRMLAERICVVSTETFDEETAVTFEEYVTTAPGKATSDDDAADPDAMDIELLEEEQVDFGEIALQHAAMALDPYPRAPDAPAGSDEDADAPTPQRPFAGLDQLLQNAKRKE